jgi:hypothetical protein
MDYEWDEPLRFSGAFIRCSLGCGIREQDDIQFLISVYDALLLERASTEACSSGGRSRVEGKVALVSRFTRLPLMTCEIQ